MAEPSWGTPGWHGLEGQKPGRAVGSGRTVMGGPSWAGQSHEGTGVQPWQVSGDAWPRSAAGGHGWGRRREGRLLGAGGTGRRLDVRNRKLGGQSLRVLSQGCGGGAGRGAQIFPRQQPTASVLVSKERSSEGTSALLLLGD